MTTPLIYILIFALPLLVLGFQMLFAVFISRQRRQSQTKFGFPLGSKSTGASLLEGYCKIYRNVNIKVSPATNQVAYAYGDSIAINRSHVYNKDLYTSIIVAIELSLTDTKFQELQNNALQQFFFLVEIVLIIGGVAFNSIVLSIIGVTLAILLIISGYYRSASFSFVKQDVINFTQDLLNLDREETKNARQLLAVESRRFHIYPLQTIASVLSFLGLKV